MKPIQRALKFHSRLWMQLLPSGDVLNKSNEEMPIMEIVYTYLGMVIKTVLIIGFALLLKYDGSTKSFKMASRHKFYTGVALLLVAILFNFGSAAYFGWNPIAESNLEVASIFASGVIYFTGLAFIGLSLFHNKNKRPAYEQSSQV